MEKIAVGIVIVMAVIFTLAALYFVIKIIENNDFN